MGAGESLLTSFDVNSGRPVVNMTGLMGEYEIVVDIPLPANGRATPIDEAPRPFEDAWDPRGAPQVAQSLKILGLQLKNTKAPIEYLVVDHGEKIQRRIEVAARTVDRSAPWRVDTECAKPP
jgi:uncharacterized protein (TIGR03435 family)